MKPPHSVSSTTCLYEHQPAVLYILQHRYTTHEVCMNLSCPETPDMIAKKLNKANLKRKRDENKKCQNRIIIIKLCQ